MAPHPERCALVQTLRAHGRSCSVALCRDDSGRALVTAMMEKLRASAGTKAQKRDAEKTFKLYEATFNNNYDVTGLCMGFPRRLDKLVNVTKGDRLRT